MGQQAESQGLLRGQHHRVELPHLVLHRGHRHVRESERESERESVCVCVRERERVCVCVSERESVCAPAERPPTRQFASSSNHSDAGDGLGRLFVEEEAVH